MGILRVLWGKILGKLIVQLEPPMILQQGWLSGKRKHIKDWLGCFDRFKKKEEIGTMTKSILKHKIQTLTGRSVKVYGRTQKTHN